MGEPCKILVVDDEELHRVVVGGVLEIYGHEVHAVTNGLEALESVKNVHYDVVLMDCCMPTMDGYEATTRIRAREGNGRRVPIIAYTTQSDREACFRAGMDDYLYKPADPEVLAASVQRWKNGSSAYQA